MMDKVFITMSIVMTSDSGDLEGLFIKPSLEFNLEAVKDKTVEEMHKFLSGWVREQHPDVRDVTETELKEYKEDD